MAKNNKNKGFSLIEIVIAIAILSLLLIPIISQFTETMRMNRRSKEQQKANENAQYTLEYFKGTSMPSLQKLNVGEDLVRTDYQEIEMKDDNACHIYVTYLDAIFDTSIKMPYHIYKFELQNEEIGSRKTEYKRTVYMDDLSTCVKAVDYDFGGHYEGLRIAYDLPDDLETPTVNIPGASDHFTRTNEGSYVVYDESGQYVRAIICESRGGVIDNPNTMNSGNVHDLNSEGVALITGYATDFDQQADRDMYARAMERLREADEEAWMIEMSKDDPSSSYIYDTDFFENTKKLLKITVKDVEAGGEDPKYTNYYEVNADVIYESQFLGAASSDQFVYNAYNQKFYYDKNDSSHKPPYIYLEYQPRVRDSMDGAEGFVEYAWDDYIYVDSQVEDMKLYLYKPKWDHAHSYMNAEDVSYTDDEYYMTYATAAERNILKNEDATEEAILEIKSKIDKRQQIYYRENYYTDYYIDRFNELEKVKIHLIQGASSKKIMVYTNMDATDVGDGNKQFDLDDTSTYGSYFKNRSYKDDVDADGKNIRVPVEEALSVTDFPSECFKSITEEENSENRYYTVSVHMTPVDNEFDAIILNGAKGEN